VTQVAVLAYHSVGTDAGPAFTRWQVPPGLLEEQLSAVEGAGFHLRGLSSLLADGDPRCVGLTFDDGYADFLDALPVIQRHARSVTLYVPTALLGGRAQWLTSEGEGDRRLLSWDDVADLPGMLEVGSHSRTHRALDLASAAELEAEVAGSRRDLEQHLGHAVRTFAYPFGFHDARVREAVSAAGYQSACEVGYRRHRLESTPLRVSRLLVTPSISPERLTHLVTGRARQIRQVTRWARPLHRRIRRGRSQREAT
jgi:peptidoglycan/xylan/chitin deacetylase (PgdA/CDA1 family)